MSIFDKTVKGTTGVAVTTMKDVVEAPEGAEREGKIAELVGCMSLEEKVGQMSGNTRLYEMIRYNHKPFDAGENQRLSIPPIRFTDGPRGVALNHSTCFPATICRGASWDRSLEERIGDVMGIESRAQGANFSGAVCINVLRFPGWGRAQETYGEDPFHLGEMGVRLVRGLQNHVMACVKHFAANSIENTRFRVDVRIDERTLREVYLPHFKKCIDAGAAAVMSAYNRVNGHYCGHNRHLLRDILKEDWGFDGLVMSDFLWGVRDGEKGACGGLDIEMPCTFCYGKKLVGLVKNGDVPESDIDEATTRIIRQKARFAHVGRPDGYPEDAVARPEHVALALEAARKGIVLLKNCDDVLPLDRKKVETIAVIGRLADMCNLGDNGSSRVRPPECITPLEGIRRLAGDDVEVLYNPGRNISAARTIAGKADAVIIVAGLTARDEGEFISVLTGGGDRPNLALPPVQEHLISGVAGVNDNTIVVLEGGSAITMSPWLDWVEAVLTAWYPGMAGGTAIAEILFGDTNPSGRLPVAFPRSENQCVHFNNRVRHIDYSGLHGYRYMEKQKYEPLYHFGFGLSYTTFEYSSLVLSAERVPPGGTVTASVDVKNTGARAGDEVVQLYIGYEGSAFERPVRELKGFERISLEPGETKTVTFTVSPSALACYNVEDGAWVTEQITYNVFAGPSSNPGDLSLSATFIVV